MENINSSEVKNNKPKKIKLNFSGGKYATGKRNGRT